MIIEYTEVMIPVGELRLGMHVIRLGCSWAETDFLIQSFIIEDPETLSALVLQCDYVYIEGKIKVVYINKISTEKALPLAKMAYTSAKATVENIMDGIRIGRMIDMNEARETVKQLIR